MPKPSWQLVAAGVALIGLGVPLPAARGQEAEADKPKDLSLVAPGVARATGLRVSREDDRSSLTQAWVTVEDRRLPIRLPKVVGVGQAWKVARDAGGMAVAWDRVPTFATTAAAEAATETAREPGSAPKHDAYDVVALVPLVAAEIRFVAFDLWGRHVRTLIHVALVDVAPGRPARFKATWTLPADEPPYATTIAYVARVRTRGGQVLNADPEGVVAEARRVCRDFNASGLESAPSKDVVLSGRAWPAPLGLADGITDDGTRSVTALGAAGKRLLPLLAEQLTMARDGRRFGRGEDERRARERFDGAQLALGSLTSANTGEKFEEWATSYPGSLLLALLDEAGLAPPPGASAPPEPSPPPAAPARAADSSIAANESAAIGTLRSLTTAQEQFRQQNQVDQDGDGMGEYGWLGELAGVDVVRVLGVKCSTSPFIASVLGVKDANGCAQKRGYFFRVFLPTGRGAAAGEAQGAATATAIDADAQEVRWCCYAWPAVRGQTGNRVFFTSSAGEVYATAAKAKAYSGATLMPTADAAFDAAGGGPKNLDAGVGLLVAGLTACDGNVWVPAGN